MKDEAKAGALRSGGPSAGGSASTDDVIARRPFAARPAKQLDDVTRTRLGTQLRAMYDQIAHQPVPDRFRDLIARLEANDAPAAVGDRAGERKDD